MISNLKLIYSSNKEVEKKFKNKICFLIQNKVNFTISVFEKETNTFLFKTSPVKELAGGDYSRVVTTQSGSTYVFEKI